MNKLMKAASLSATCLLMGTVNAQGTGNSATSSDTSMTSSVTQDRQSIRRVQEQLRSKGYPVGRVDGNMGPRTSQALRDFQSSNGISATGQIDQQTMSALGGTAASRTTESTSTTTTTGSTTGTTSGSQMGRTTTSDDAGTQPMNGTTQQQGRSPTNDMGTGTGMTNENMGSGTTGTGNTGTGTSTGTGTTESTTGQ